MGCKRSRVQIPAARPNVSNTCRFECSLKPATGVQNGRHYRPRLASPSAVRASTALILPASLSQQKTRHFRHLESKSLTTIGQSLSGRSNFRTYDPTKWSEEPDKSRMSRATSQNAHNPQKSLLIHTSRRRSPSRPGASKGSLSRVQLAVPKRAAAIISSAVVSPTDN